MSFIRDITNNKPIGKINPNDEYYTPAYAVEPIMKYLIKGSNILCPFDTKDSEFVKCLSKEHKVTHSHIFEGKNFFKIKRLEGIDYIISNPPYSKKIEVFEKLFDLGVPFAMLIGGVGIFDSLRKFELFSKNEF